MSHDAIKVYDTPERAGVSRALPWVLAVLALVLIVAGIVWYV